MSILSFRSLKLSVEIMRQRDGYAVKVTADTFLKDLCLMADRLDPTAVVDSMLVTLLPGESHAFAGQDRRRPFQA